MKVGEYIRTKQGRIGKISNLTVDYSNELILCEESSIPFAKHQIIKSSPNIIDLIEYGDIVKYEIDNEEFIFEVWGEKNDYFVQYFDLPIDLRDLNIVSILTKEQFESMEYKVKE